MEPVRGWDCPSEGFWSRWRLTRRSCDDLNRVSNSIWSPNTGKTHFDDICRTGGRKSIHGKLDTKEYTNPSRSEHRGLQFYTNKGCKNVWEKLNIFVLNKKVFGVKFECLIEIIIPKFYWILFHQCWQLLNIFRMLRIYNLSIKYCKIGVCIYLKVLVS